MKTTTQRNADATTIANKLAMVFAEAEKLGVTITVDTDDGTHAASNPIASDNSTHNETGDAIVTICTDGQYEEGDINWGE
jgi:tRNA U38,U39,U40 pseudouridine synthase TruA